MADINISFNDGSQRIILNDDPSRVIRWTPSDIDFVDRFIAFKAYVETALRERINQVGSALDGNAPDALDRYEAGTFQALGAEFNAELDKAFGAAVSAAAFMGVNPLSPVENGRLLFDNFLNALTPVIEQSIKNFEGARAKYTEGSRNRAERRAARAGEK